MAATFPGGVWAGYTVVDLVDYWNAATANPISVEIMAVETFLISTTRTANTFFAGPAAGAAAAAAFRAQALADIPFTARGTILRGGATAYEELAAETNLQVLIGDGTDLTSRTLLGSDTPQATTTDRGTVEFATDAEVATGTDAGRGVVVSGLRFDLPLVPAALKGVRLDASGDLILPGHIEVADGESVGIGPAAERVEFYTAGHVAVMGANLGVGVASPGAKLTVVDGSASLTFSAASSARALQRLIHQGVPGAGDEIAILQFLSYNSISSETSFASLHAYADDATDGSEDGRLVIKTRIAGSLTAVTTFQGGNTLIGTTLPPSANGGKVLVFGDNAAAPTMDGNTGGMYCRDVAGTVEVMVMSEDDVEVQLTAHNYELFSPLAGTLHWAPSHTNPYAGQQKVYDMERALLALEALTGETFIHTRQLPASERRNWERDQHERLKKALLRGEKYTMKARPSWL